MIFFLSFLLFLYKLFHHHNLLPLIPSLVVQAFSPSWSSSSHSVLGGSSFTIMSSFSHSFSCCKLLHHHVFFLLFLLLLWAFSQPSFSSGSFLIASFFAAIFFLCFLVLLCAVQCRHVQCMCNCILSLQSHPGVFMWHVVLLLAQ